MKKILLEKKNITNFFNIQTNLHLPFKYYLLIFNMNFKSLSGLVTYGLKKESARKVMSGSPLVGE